MMNKRPAAHRQCRCAFLAPGRGFQRERRFAKAAESCRQMLVKVGADVEILWRLAMCRCSLECLKVEDEFGCNT